MLTTFIPSLLLHVSCQIKICFSVEQHIKNGKICEVENNKGVRIFNWTDRKRVVMIQQFMDLLISQRIQEKKHRKGEPIMKPKAVLDYKIKKGVGIRDQMSILEPLKLCT